MLTKRAILGLVLALAATPAVAHTGHGAADSFSAGLLHPVFGADHLLAMLAVGLWAALAVPRLAWVAPAGFLAGMLGGGIAGFAGVTVPGVELAIVASVVVFGLLALAAVRLPTLAGFAAAGLFGAAHGLAHGAEMPLGGSAAEYAIGFLLATAALHGLGVAAGLATHRFRGRRLAQAAGGAVALIGAYLLVA